MKKKLKAVLYYVVLFFLVGVFLFSAWMMYSEIRVYEQEKKANDQLNQYVSVPESVQTQEQTIQKDPFPVVDFDSLREINSDCIGWIYIPDTNVNYPIVQTTNNDYYLKRLFDRKWGNSGTIFLDAENDSSFTDRHSILYGHHMKNKTMFGNVEDYERQEYAEERPVGYLVTLDARYEIYFFAGYVTDALNDCWTLDFMNDTDFEVWLNNSKERSAFESEITPDVSDHIITLSTCSYDIADGRFVLLGILVEKES